MRTLKITLTLCLLLILKGAIYSQASKSQLEKFKKKNSISKKYENGYVFYNKKKKKKGFAGSDLKVLVKPMYDVLFYSEENHSVLAANSAESHNDGGGKITTGYGELQLIDLNTQKSKPILTDYIIHNRSFSSFTNEVGGKMHLVVKNIKTKKLNVIDLLGKKLFKQEYDIISGKFEHGNIYGISTPTRNNGTYDILDLSGKILYRSVGIYEKNPQAGLYSISNSCHEVSNPLYGLSMPAKNRFNLLDLVTQKEILQNDYSRIEMLRNLPKEADPVFVLEAEDQNLSVFSSELKKIVLTSFIGKIKFRKGHENQTMLLCTKPTGVFNIYSIEKEAFIYPMWVSELKRVQGKNHMRILIAEIDGDTQYGIFDESKGVFVKDMSRSKISEEYSFSAKTKKGMHKYSYKVNGEKVFIDLDQ